MFNKQMFIVAGEGREPVGAGGGLVPPHLLPALRRLPRPQAMAAAH